MAVLALIFLGRRLQGIGVDLLPNIELPVAVITLSGADPATVEADVTNRLEELTPVPGLTRCAPPAPNTSIITAEFEWAPTHSSDETTENNVASARALPRAPSCRSCCRPIHPNQPVMMVAVAGAEDPVEDAQGRDLRNPGCSKCPGSPA